MYNPDFKVVEFDHFRKSADGDDLPICQDNNGNYYVIIR